MKEQETFFLTPREIWQNKSMRYGVISLIVFAILVIVAPFFPHLWPIWVAIALICAIVFVVCSWMVTKAEGGF